MENQKQAAYHQAEGQSQDIHMFLMKICRTLQVRQVIAKVSK